MVLDPSPPPLVTVLSEQLAARSVALRDFKCGVLRNRASRAKKNWVLQNGTAI